MGRRIGISCVVLAAVLASPVATAQAAAGNPFFEEWQTPFGIPPFDRIQEAHFLPALKAGIEAQQREVRAIAGLKAAPTFLNTVQALDRTGSLLDKVRGVFSNLLSAETTPGLQAIAREAAPLMAALEDDTWLDPGLWKRVQDVARKRTAPGLTPEDRRLIDETVKRFIRGGAALDAKGQARLREIHGELSLLGLRFGDNLLAETNAFRLVVDRAEDLAGLPESMRAAGGEAAAKAGLPGKWLFTLHGPSLWPFLQNAETRDLRRQMLMAYAARGSQGNERDNREILARTAALRLEKARLLGFATWADFVLDDRMAKTPARVRELLDRLWAPAKAVAMREATALREAMTAAGAPVDLRPWDWWLWAERVRKARFGLDDAVLRPYFALDRVMQGAFTLAGRLYGVRFHERTGLPMYHPEVRSFEVVDADGSHLGLFLVDYHPRPGKRGGAWSNRYRGQYEQDGRDVRPIVVNVGSFTRPAGDVPALLSMDEVETLFHELGHGLHALLSRVRHRGLAGVPRDFVELPSQIMENWVLEPEVLALYARHWKTGESMPAELVRRIQDAGRFNQGWATVEYLAASYLDLAWHGIEAPVAASEVAAFEQAALARIGLPAEILPRYRSGYFQHIFGPGGGYSAGYYAYIWSEVLDADAYAAFKERGLFDSATARAFRTRILERGNTMDAAEMYRSFRGRDPEVGPLLKRRGLDGTP